MKIISLLYIFKQKHPLIAFITSRTISMIATLYILGFFVFGLMQLAPGDVVDSFVIKEIMNAEGRNEIGLFKAEQIAAMKKRLGLDKPFYIQYHHWLKQVFIHQDLGRSLISRAPVLFLVRSRLINSLILNLLSLFFITILSFALGIYFSSKAGTKFDYISGGIMMVLHAFPWILMLILMQIFAAASGLFPITAYPGFPYSEAPVKFVFKFAHHIILPLLAAFLSGIGGTVRMIRATMLDQLNQPYITAIRSRGIDEKRIFFNHAFRNTLNPYITSSANLLAGLFSGSLILEIVFSYPGIGKLMYEAVIQEDINLVLTNIMFISFLVLAGMLLSDILLAIVDPRIRYSKS
ncbi:MAG: ABC transporter permease [Spirochaetes bacterium GWF1_31_7]|nr:MAG: ABC transporter permease [Spirochaetes bacterium GWE1_32_154]OHD52083.1 MAG: ABC transporter permease [Spirochaetes bacterium GWF1_31_7]OHD81027.1 MAG: ABC transporter permease [Spirochaetes bacterium RIFOXYB1_FULL_32_8]HBD93258.1 ABC transporter permease [Spirochaetia bacterium]